MGSCSWPTLPINLSLLSAHGGPRVMSVAWLHWVGQVLSLALFLQVRMLMARDVEGLSQGHVARE